MKHTNRAINQCSDRTAKNIEGGPLSLCEVCTQLWLHRQDDKWNAIVLASSLQMDPLKKH